MPKVSSTITLLLDMYMYIATIVVFEFLFTHVLKIYCNK